MEWLFAMQRYCKWATVNAKGVYLTKTRQNWYGMLSAKIQSIRFSTLVRKHLMQEKKLLQTDHEHRVREDKRALATEQGVPNVRSSTLQAWLDLTGK